MQAGAHMKKRPAPVDDSCSATDSEAGHESSDETWHCNRCDVTKPVGKFAKWAVRSRNHICRSCALVRSQEAHKLRKGSLDRRLMACMRKSMHRAGFTRSATLKLELPMMQELVQRQGERSILSGIFDLDRLTVARWDSSKPWCFSNLVIVTHAEAREHNRRSLEDYHPTYVQHVEHQLLLPPEAIDHATECMQQPAQSFAVQRVWPPYPPKSLHKRGVTSDTAMWYINNWKIMYPTLRSSSHASRPDLVPRPDAPLLEAAS